MGELLGSFAGGICALGLLSFIARLVLAMVWRQFMQIAL